MQKLKQYSVFICLITSVLLIVIATFVYPGGSLADKHSVGFHWSKNFISNLFLEYALNGAPNKSRVWATLGMAFNAVGHGLFFIHMARKIPVNNAAIVLKTVGWLNILFNFLIATPLHDSMIVLSSTLSLLGLFYITVFIFRTRRHVLKFCCTICLLIFYYSLYVYGAGDLGWLAIMQKIALICSTLLVLGLEYFTSQKDFAPQSLEGHKKVRP